MTSRTYTETADGFKDTATAEVQKGSLSACSTANDRSKDATAVSGSKSGQTSSVAAPSNACSTALGVAREADGSIFVTSSFSAELLAAMKGSVACLQLRNDENSYAAILAFSPETIQSKKNTLDEIIKKINQSGLVAKIEIISRENSQKTGRIYQ